MTPALLLRLSIAVALACCAYLLAMQVSIGYPYQYAGLFSDGVSYLYMADILSGREPATHAIAVLHWRHSQFPPGFAAILALVGAGSGSPERGLLLQAALTLVAALALVVYFRRLTGSVEVALLMLVPCLLMPWHIPWSLEISSEPLFFCLLLALLLVAQSALPDRRKLLLLGVICGMLCLVRNAGLPMALAIAVWGLARRLGTPRVLLTLLAAVAPMAAWMLFKLTVAQRASYADALPLFLERALTEPLGLARVQAEAFFNGLSFTEQGSGSGMAIAAAMLLLALPSIWQRCRSAELDASFLALYLPLALVWPYPAESTRLLGVVQPLLLAQSWLTLRALIERYRTASPAFCGRTAALLCVGVLLLSPGATSMLARAHQPSIDPDLDTYRRSSGWFLSPAPDAYAESAHRLVLIARQSNEVVPAEGCIYATNPSLVSLHSRRMTYMTPAVVVSPAGEPAATRCEYFVVSSLVSLQGNGRPLHPLGSDGGQLRPILVSWRGEGANRVLMAALMSWKSAAARLPARDPVVR